MVDKVDPETRSRIMATVTGTNTTPELTLRRALHSRGLRYRLHNRELPGTPDLTFPRFKAVCFVHGCFWHRHADCYRTTVPATRREFWRAKFKSNVERDCRVQQALLADGWRVAIVWECALRIDRKEATTSMLETWLRGDGRQFETSPYRSPPRC